MFTPRCEFCGHGNRAGAKICSVCNSPLAFKTCNECGADNDRSAQRCRQCGAALPIDTAATDEALESVAAESAAHLTSSGYSGFVQHLRRLRHAPAHSEDPLRENDREPAQIVMGEEGFVGSVTPVFSATPRPERAGDKAEARLADETAVPAPRRLHFPSTFHWTSTRGGWAVSVPRMPPLAALRVLEVNVQRHLITRVAPAVLVAAGVVALGYLAHRYTANDARTVFGGVGISTRADDATTPSPISSDKVASPATHGRIRTAGAIEVGRPTDVPGASTTAVPTPVPRNDASATTRQQAADSVESTAKRARAVNAQPGLRDAQTRVVRRPDPAADRERRSCTDAVAALGLCSGGATREGR